MRRGSADLGELLAALQGIGLLLMSIDARLENVVSLLGGEDEEETDT